MKRPTIKSTIGGAVFLFLALSLIATAQSASVQTVQLQSKLVNATLPYNVILPADCRFDSWAFHFSQAVLEYRL